MASVYQEIRAVFETTLNGISGLPDIAWENVSFSPTTNESYIQARMFPTMREPANRGTNPQMYYQGYYLFEIYCPEGVGPSTADNLADTLIDNFEATTDISYDGTIVSLRYAERDNGVQEGAHYMVAVRVGFYLYS